MSVRHKLTKVATRYSFGGPYQAPTSSAFGGALGAHAQGTITPTGTIVGGSLPKIPPPPGSLSPAPAAAAPSSVSPFFRPEDLITQNNFWAQWNSTFADLDHQLADLQTNTAFNRAMLADTHKSNVSGINDNAAARGISHSSIRDGNQAQEQTQYTRQDQNLQDALNSLATFVQGRKNDFNTNTLPGFNTAEDAQAVSNAQDVNSAYVPPPAAPQAAAPPVQQATTVQQAYKPVVKNGRFYHYYPAANGKPERWVYIRPASNA